MRDPPAARPREFDRVRELRAQPPDAAARRAVGGRRARVRPAALRRSSVRPPARSAPRRRSRALTIEDVVRFHDTRYDPGFAHADRRSATRRTRRLADLADAAFGGWEPAATGARRSLRDRRRRRRPIGSCSCIGQARRSRSCASATCRCRAARPTTTRCSSLNMVLGGQFVSRINMNLREDKGYTYGARTSRSTSAAVPGRSCSRRASSRKRPPTRCARRSASCARSAAIARSRTRSCCSAARR